MKSKEIYALVGILVLIIAFVWWGTSRSTDDKIASENSKQEETNNTPATNTSNSGATTQAPKPTNTGTKVPTSVNPTVTTEKPIPTLVTNKSLAGSTFKLATYNGTAVPADTKFTLSFTDNQVSFKICNTLSGNYFIDGNVIEADNVLSTQMYCSSPANIMKIESDANALLGSGMANIYKSGSTLILSYAKLGIVMAFEGF